jgi:alpha-N-arabinofuranosidase
MLSFDEWNIWYLEEHQAQEAELAAADTAGSREWPYAPRLLEDVYTAADAVVLGSLLITLLTHADRVTSASLAQLVNVIAPIMTEPGGEAWRQTTFFPFSVTSRLARGVVLRPRIAVGSYPTAKYDDAPLVDAVATFDEETGAAAVFLVNRSLTDAATVTIDLSSLGVSTIEEAVVLHDDDPYATNTRDDQERVTLSPAEAAIADGVVTVELPALSWAALAAR